MKEGRLTISGNDLKGVQSETGDGEDWGKRVYIFICYHYELSEFSS